MCEANVYIDRSGQEELLMEGVDRIIPGEDHSIFLENIFGERRVIRARIKEMELVHHRIILEEIKEAPTKRHLEIWLEPNTKHGHFHPGEEVCLELYKGYNMRSDKESEFSNPQAFWVNNGVAEEIGIHDYHGTMKVSLTREIDGMVHLYGATRGRFFCLLSQTASPKLFVNTETNAGRRTVPINFP